MARVRWSNAGLPGYIDSMWSNTEAWQYIRKAPELVAMFDLMGEQWVGDLNRELHAAQAKRKQPVEDGYKFAISHDDDRLRMRIWAFTARAMVHEARHQSILKLMRHSGFDFKQKGRAQWDWGGGGGRSRSSGGGSTRATGAGGRSGSSRRRPSMDPKREARLRRQLDVLGRLASDRGATESERKLAAERARRLRSKLGE